MIWLLLIGLTLNSSILIAADEVAPAATSSDADTFTPTNNYVHQWIRLPQASGESVRDSSTTSITSRPGHVAVIIFLASYDEPSQQMILDFMTLERKYEPLNAEFFYIFSHDTRDDALGFMEEFSIKEGILSNHSILKEFHNPDLPTIYIGDRRGWLVKRIAGPNTKNIDELKTFLQYLTAI